MCGNYTYSCLRVFEKSVIDNDTDNVSYVNSAFHPSGEGKSSTSLSGLDEGGARSPVSSGR